MEYSFISIVNRLLLMMKKNPTTSFSSTVNSDENRCKIAINDALQDISLILRIKTRLVEFTFNTIGGQRTYVMPKRIIYPFYDMRQKTSNEPIRQWIPKDFDFLIPNDISSGDPTNYYLEEYVSVENQPASSGEIVYIISSSASDNSTVVVQGYDTNNNYISDEIILNGETTVAGTLTFKSIESVSKPITVGDITFENSAASTIYQILSANETFRRNIKIGLHLIPSSVMTIYAKSWLTMPPLVNEYDLPIGLSIEHVNLIIAGGLFHYQKYDPTFPRESLAGLKQDFYDEMNKIIGQDNEDNIQYFMHSPLWVGKQRAVFDPFSPNLP